MAILPERFGDDQKALSHCEKFLIGVVANLDNSWQLTSEDIDKALTRQG